MRSSYETLNRYFIIIIIFVFFFAVHILDVSYIFIRVPTSYKDVYVDIHDYMYVHQTILALS